MLIGKRRSAVVLEENCRTVTNPCRDAGAECSSGQECGFFGDQPRGDACEFPTLGVCEINVEVLNNR